MTTTNLKSDFVIVALDLPERESAIKMVDQLPEATFFKVGMELFFSAGIGILQDLRQRNKKIFLDLKIHDIPKTMEKAVRVLQSTPPDLLTLFCGEPGIRAVKSAITGDSPTRVLNVTVLTSEEESGSTRETVMERARLTCNAGGDGIVCSGWETSAVRSMPDVPPELIIVNPGVRMAENGSDDQKRIVTPLQAKQAGATHIVVGRPVTLASDPRGAFLRLLESF